MFWSIVSFVSVCESASALFKLNATEYALLPPLFGLDDYDACLHRDRGLYCLMKVELFDTGGNPLMDMIHEYSKDATHYNHTFIERGICVRTTCKHHIHYNKLETIEDRSAVIQRCLNDSLWREYRLQAKVSLYNCDSSEETHGIDSQDWTVATIFAVLVVVTCIASCYESMLNKIDKINLKGSEFLLSFSIQRNWNTLVQSHYVDNRFNFLRYAHGIKVLLAYFVIMEHMMFLNGGGFQSNPRDFENFCTPGTRENFKMISVEDEVFGSPLYSILVNGISMVQVHFFITGFLLVYILHMQAETNRITWHVVPFAILQRMIRLVPAYAAMLALSVTWLRHLGSGALWNHLITKSAIAHCRTYWWHHLLFINNYIAEDKSCAIQTWHVAAGMQLFVVGLVVCVATMSRGRSRVLSLLMLVGCLAPALHVWMWDLDGVALLKPEFWRSANSETFFYLHVYGHTNLPAFVLGLAMGKYFYDAQREGVDISRSKAWSVLMWMSIPALLISFYSRHSLFENRSTLLVRMLLPSLQAIVMSALGAIFTIGLLRATPSFFKTLFGWAPLGAPSRLSYCVYLLHMHLIQALLGNRSYLARVTFLQTIVDYLGVVSLSYLAALPLYLLVEAPFNCIGKLMLSKLQGSSRPISSLATKKSC